MTTPIEHAAEVMWEAIDDKGINGRLIREDCTYLAEALAAAGLIATEGETRTTTTCAGPTVDGEGCPDWFRYRSCAHTITQTRNVTPWKDADA